ncbi:hypothetical protein [Stratiformator vulcanicus]|nr:hypothetical protein [Stratiformator vulcanicus]
MRFYQAFIATTSLIGICAVAIADGWFYIPTEWGLFLANPAENFTMKWAGADAEIPWSLLDLRDANPDEALSN